tara:strand:+ start:1702 stop:3210 length:1509 start_codon:yes stop_codon:yes gene_type:complete
MARQSRINPLQNPSLYSYGSNSLSSKRIFQERIKYDEYVFPDFLANNFIKTWTSDRFYGTINERGNATLPDIRRLKTLQFLQEGEDSQYSLDFVADAWYDFALRLRELADNNIIYRDSPWAKPFITKAWTPVSNHYDSYMRQTIYPAFFDDYMSSAGNNAKVKNIDTFMDLLGDFVENTLIKAGPVTLTGLVESSRVPVYASGLVLELSSDEYDDDFNKAYKFGDSNFSIVAAVAAQYGFSIDKNIPWRIVADLRNPAMLEYMLGVPIENFDTRENVEYVCDPFVGDVELPPRAYGFSRIPGLEEVVRHIAFFNYTTADGLRKTEPGYRRYKVETSAGWASSFDVTSQADTFRAMFEQDYTETWTSDIEIFEKYLLDFYNYYVALRPTALVQTLASATSGCPPTNITIQRSQISPEEFSALYSDRWKLKTFYAIRVLERGYVIPPKRRRYELQQALNIYNLMAPRDPIGAYQLALQAIQEEFIGPADTNPLTLDFVGDIIGS